MSAGFDPADGVAVLGSGAMATALSVLLARGGVPLTVHSRSAERAGWLVEDVLETVPGAVVAVAPTARAAVLAHPVLLPALPWGAPLQGALSSLAGQLPGRTVLDVANPYEMTALGPKLAVYVPHGSAGAGTAAALPEGTGHLHAFTHVRADALEAGSCAGAVLPYVSHAVPDDAAAALLSATGWVPQRVGDVGASALIEEAGAWSRVSGAAGRGLLSRAEAVAAGLLPA